MVVHMAVISKILRNQVNLFLNGKLSRHYGAFFLLCNYPNPVFQTSARVDTSISGMACSIFPLGTWVVKISFASVRSIVYLGEH